MTMKTLFKRSAFALALLGANQALAGGLWLNDWGDFAGGRASAGASAGTDDAATIIHNPAGSALIKGSQLFLSAGAFIPKAEFDVDESHPFVGDGDGGQAGLDAPGASFAYTNDLGSDKWSTGISFGGLSGAGLDYGNNWVGRYQSTEVELILLALAPSVAYKITDKLSVGVKAQYYYSSLDLKLRAPTSLVTGAEDGRVKLDGDDTGWGYNVGAIYEFSADTRVGITYQSKFDIKYGGDLKIKPAGLKASSDTELTMAATVRASLHHDLNDRLGLDFTVGWDNWSDMDNVLVAIDTGAGAALEKNWEDTYHYAAGFQYKLNEDWDLTAGVAYDTNPVDSHDRTADLPVDRQVRYNAGARYALSDTLTLGGYVNYIDLGSAKIEAHLWSGEYSTNEVYSFSVFANWQL
ncbi:MAG: hypothetical protein DRQ65_06215 [Gammaproteobacteria bacterium]|nr:MAG: hypothetical protein DRQ65_06215 [Gammaproteobacteria bacterium]RLA56242.1 MAG: hypothetical protein DRQ98_02760 [Gammaproteobacteria bacterium]